MNPQPTVLETVALPIELLAYPTEAPSARAVIPVPFQSAFGIINLQLFLLRLLMQDMLAASGAELLLFQPFRALLLIAGGSVVPLFAFRARQSD